MSRTWQCIGSAEFQSLLTLQGVNLCFCKVPGYPHARRRPGGMPTCADQMTAGHCVGELPALSTSAATGGPATVQQSHSG